MRNTSGGGGAGLDPVVLELRIHGVSNTPPHSMLDLPEGDIVRADGDELGSFWQRKPDAANPPADARGHTPDGVRREAYSWGNLARSTFTAGSGVVATIINFIVRMLWTLLLPFALTNVAYWSRRLHDVKDDDGSFEPLTKGHAGGAWVLRLAGMSLTLMVAVTALVLSVDLVGIQCQPAQRGQRSGCTAIPDAVGFIDRWSMGARMAFTSLIPLLLVLALFALSVWTRTRFELATRNQDPTNDGAPVTRTFPDCATGTPRWPLLSTPGFWNHSRVATPAATTHLSATGAVVVGLCAEHLRENAQTGQPAATWWLLLALAATLVLVWTLIVQAGLDPLAADVDSAPGTGSVIADKCDTRARRTLAAAVLLYLTFVFAAPFQDTNTTARRPMTSVHWAVTVLAVVIIMLIVAALGVRSVKKAGKSRTRSSLFQSLLGLPLAIVIVVLPSWPISTWAWQLPVDNRGVVIAVVSASCLTVAALTTWAYVRSRASTNITPTDSPAVENTNPSKETDSGAHLSERDRTGWGGRGPGVFLALGAFFGFVILSALTLFVGDRLNGDHSAGSLAGSPVLRTFEITTATGSATTAGSTPPAPPAAPELIVPGLYGWFAVAAVGGLVLMLLFLAAVNLICWGKLPSIEAIPGAAEGSPTYCSVRRVRRMARIAHRAESLLAVLLVSVLIAGVALAVALQIAGVAALALWTNAITGAAFVLAGVAVGVIGGEGATAGRTAARPLGILWDLACSVPRAAHPLGPPCYGERVVPEVLERCRRWLTDGTGPRSGSRPSFGLAGSPEGIVLSAHSLGGVIAVAAILGAPRPENTNGEDVLGSPGLRGDWMVPRLALITYGTQLRAYFGRFFPELFGPAILGVRPVRCARLLAADPWEKDWIVDTFEPPEVLNWSLRNLLMLHPGDTEKNSGGKQPGARWYNLWHPTDFLGFPAIAPTKTGLVEPNLETWKALHDRYASEQDNTAYLLSILTHSDYPRTTEYGKALESAISDLRSPL